MRGRISVVACLVVARAAAGFAPAHARGAMLLRAQPLRAPLYPFQLQQTAALRPPPRSAVVASLSSVTETSFAPRTLARAALAFIASALAFVLASTRFAFAAERTLRRTAPVGFSISGDVIKYSFVGACMVLGYVCRREETPIIRETPGAMTLDPETLQAPPSDAAAEGQADDTPLSDALPEVILDDASLFGSFQARMQALAEERAKEEAADAADGEAPPPPTDSTDSWGTGNTAVLEPPPPDRPRDEDEAPSERGVLDGEPRLEFPTGFPLVDGEVVEVDQTPAASADQVAMLNRMFGKTDD